MMKRFLRADHDQARSDQMISEGGKLPSPPSIAVRILIAIQKDESSIDELAEIIATDPALTAKTLRVANSGLYRLKNEVTSIEKALTVLGVNVLPNIALFFVIAQELQSTNILSFDFDYFWRRSITSAVAAQLPNEQIVYRSDGVFVSAMLNDIGILILYVSMPDGYTRVLEEKS